MKYKLFDQGENLTTYEPIRKLNILERTVCAEDLTDKFRKKPTDSQSLESKEVYTPITSLVYAMPDDKDEEDDSCGKGQCGGGCNKGKDNGQGSGCGGGKGKGKKDGSGGGCDKDTDND